MTFETRPYFGTLQNGTKYQQYKTEGVVRIIKVEYHSREEEQDHFKDTKVNEQISFYSKIKIKISWPKNRSYPEKKNYNWVWGGINIIIFLKKI